MVVVRFNKNQILIFFLKKLKKFLFFRNPIFFYFAKRTSFIKFICLKKYLFLIIYFKTLAIPIKLNLKYTKHLKKKKS